ncbi:hypothetical protein Pla52o_51540 [Novipirellula galeiformis]|uniref:Uncharacterized protein n=1 Tax=Novipirellula galeiformis TaxID=2528004 RepID=A0A5C6BYE7_9BACT|nr:hypothetical protein Pla52o_51540 [Novipirellula galeiformis]
MINVSVEFAAVAAEITLRPFTARACRHSGFLSDV